MNLIFRPEFECIPEYVFGDEGRLSGKLENTASKKLGRDELPSPTDDNIFKIVFAREDTKEFACYLFSTILANDLEFLIANMKFYKNEFSKKKRKERAERADVNFLCDGVFFSFEMNNTNILERNQEYAHRLYSEFANQKKLDKKTDYRTVIQFNINNFSIRGIDKTIDICYRKTGEYRRSKIIYVDIYLPLIKKKYEKEGIESLSEAERKILAMFIARTKEANKLRKGDMMIKKFIETLKSLKKDDEVMEAYYNENSRVTAGRIHGRQEGREIGREIGREEGREEGRQEAQVEMAKKMLKKGIDPQSVQEYTDLSLNKIKSIMTML